MAALPHPALTLPLCKDMWMPSTPHDPCGHEKPFLHRQSSHIDLIKWWAPAQGPLSSRLLPGRHISDSLPPENSRQAPVLHWVLCLPLSLPLYFPCAISSSAFRLPHTSLPLRYPAPATARSTWNFLKFYSSFHISPFFGKMRLAQLTNHISISSMTISGVYCLPRI